MIDTAKPQELERRKAVKLRLRHDLAIEAQKYEGRTFYVLKDPVSLRYYRLKDNEHFLLQFLDGERTLEEAQKAYEKRYRPERLKLEDLEAFAQQLLTAGLAQNESPRAGKQLFERRKKRRRTELFQALTNILYIKIPLIDPDRLLQRMLRYVGWVFSLWFFVLSVGLMLGAVVLVATHFDTFRAKLPNYHEFFSFKTIVYLWAALAVVKVIHEFGHGISCKRFGGEVHEMGALFLCLSPALYCNVSDAWTLPNKWHRIIISGAGIYVELIIAAIATFVWWNTPSQPFVNNLALSLMVVCSVSTVVFNANPLMRYDGYYVLSDWLEIPNLREKSNRYLTNLFLDKCLGVEVQPEGYMELWRRVLFVTYAIVSYIYRWVVTFTILWFMYNFLRPYKLEVISTMLALASLASLTGWPIYRLFRNIHRRGRLPDMKRVRVLVTSSVALALVLFVFFVPVPVSRVRGVGLVEAKPEAHSKLEVQYSGLLIKLNVRDGDRVEQGDVLAEFSNTEADTKLRKAQRDRKDAADRFVVLEKQWTQAVAVEQKIRLEDGMQEAKKNREAARTEVQKWTEIKEMLVLKAPRSGIVSGLPSIDRVEQKMERGEPFCAIVEPARVRVLLPVVTSEYNQLRENLLRTTPAARAAWSRLNRVVSVSYSKTPLKDVLADLEKQGKGIKLKLDTAAGLPTNMADVPVEYHANHKRLSQVIDEIFTTYGLGYVINSSEGAAEDGWLIVRSGQERGVAHGQQQVADLAVTIRIHGRDSHTWQGKILHLPEKEADKVPLALSSRAGGPVAVKGGVKSNTLVPQTQHFLVEVEIIDPDPAIVPGVMAQVKVHCKNETCAKWLWRTVNNLFDLGLI
jgi:putative peptide zinc metalloprotease protein